jgi:DNA invertase Pin-like site-specific DNA recombinase
MPSLTGSKPGLRVAIYARVSTEDQADNYSLPAQLDRCRDYAVRAKWVVAGEYVDDGVSGRHTRRPKYRQMMHDLEKWDVILVAKMDRIHRNSRNFMLMIDDLEKAEKSFASSNENVDTSTAIGRFVMQVIQLIAQLESEQIGERVKDGQRKKMQTEKCYPYPAPLGFANVDGNLAVAKEAVTVRKAYELYDTDVPLSYVAQVLSAQGQTKWGNGFSADRVREMLRNAVHIGVLQADNFVRAFNHPPLVDIDLFLRVQSKLDERGLTVKHKPPSAAWLAARQSAIQATKENRAYEEVFEE